MSLRITPLTDPEPVPPGRLAWLAAHADGTPVGSAFLRLFATPERAHLAHLELHVHPAERRAGAGTRLLAAAAAAARGRGRRAVMTQAEPGTPGDRFLVARGFRGVLALTYARLPLAGVRRTTLDEITGRRYPGYRLVRWEGAVPDELAESFAAAFRAMDDMPRGGADQQPAVWDVARVRAAARVVAARGDLLHTVAAVHETSGAVVGFTELVVPGSGTGDGQHYGTAVLPEHRGRGLAHWMKAEAIRQAVRRHPRLDGLLTDTADENLPMRAVNEALGYQPTHRSLQYQLDLPQGATDRTAALAEGTG